MEVNKTQRNPVQLHRLYVTQDVDTAIGIAYNVQAITIRIFLEVVSGISVLEIRHYDERSDIKYVRTKEFYQPFVGSRY